MKNSETIFVFGSNLAGRHGKGAARYALTDQGAVYGRGTGVQGSSYAIPTKDADLKVLPLADIQVHVKAFIAYARANQSLVFEVTEIGCGYAGYHPEDIAPFFAEAPANCILPPRFLAVLGRST